MSQKINPVQDPDEGARALACDLLLQARTAALGVIHPKTHAPYVSRIAVIAAPGRAVFSLVSDLSLHCQALRADPRASLLLGDPGPRGDPLNQPRLSIQAVASFVDPVRAADQDLRTLWLSRHPKSKLYIDFADFSFVDFTILGANLNGGFAKAYALGPNDFKINQRND